MDRVEAIEMLKLEESTVSDDCDNFYKGYCSVYEDGCFHQCEKDYISRKQAIEALGEEPEIARDTDEEWAERDAWVIHRNAIASLPPVTPPKRVVAEIKVDTEELVKRIKEECQVERTGKWIKRYTDELRLIATYTCSECGSMELSESKYCPNCGADMRGDRE